MRPEISHVIDDVMRDDVWSNILSPETHTILDDLQHLSTDYSCHGCKY